MKQFVSISFVIMVATACGIGEKYSDEREANEVTIQSIEEFLTELEQYEDSAVNQSRSKRLKRLQTLEAALKDRGDTLNADEAQAMADLSAQGEPYHPFSVESGAVSAKLRRSQAALQALNHDLKNNLLPADSVRYMVNHERRFADNAMAEAEKILNANHQETVAGEAWYQKADSLEQNLINEQK